CGSTFGVGQTDVARGISPKAPRVGRFTGPSALSRVFAFACAIARGRNRRTFATGTIHPQFIARLKRPTRRSEGAVSIVGRGRRKNLAVGGRATRRRAKLSVAHLR